VEGVIRRTHGEADEEEHLFSNHGASTPDFDAETGVTTHDSSLGDISVTDHTIFGSNSNEVVDEATAVPPRYRSVKPNE
jgi:hypothetical protein